MHKLREFARRPPSRGDGFPRGHDGGRGEVADVASIARNSGINRRTNAGAAAASGAASHAWESGGVRRRHGRPLRPPHNDGAFAANILAGRAPRGSGPPGGRGPHRRRGASDRVAPVVRARTRYGVREAATRRILGHRLRRGSRVARRGQYRNGVTLAA